MTEKFDINQALARISDASKDTFDVNDILNIEPSNKTELADGSTISRAGNEFYVSKTIDPITYTSTFKVTDKGQTITPISTDMFDSHQNNGLASSSIHYDYFTEDGVEQVRLTTHSTLDDSNVASNTKHRSVTEESVVENKSALLDSLAQPIALVSALYSRIPIEEKLELEAETNPELNEIRRNLKPSGTSFADRLAMEEEMKNGHYR